MGLWESYKKLWTAPIEKVSGLFSSGDGDVSVATSAFPIDVITAENDLYGKLTVPTQKEGATISQSGWRIGGDTIARTTSSGTVEENPYKDMITRLRVHEDEIELGVMLDTGMQAKSGAMNGKPPERTMRIPIGEITDVRTQQINRHPGFAFETEEDVYKIAVQANEGVLTASHDFESQWVERLVERIRENSEKHSASDEGGRENAVGQIERLKELHDDGALTDQEFESKKQELLDDV